VGLGVSGFQGQGLLKVRQGLGLQPAFIVGHAEIVLDCRIIGTSLFRQGEVLEGLPQISGSEELFTHFPQLAIAVNVHRIALEDRTSTRDQRQAQEEEQELLPHHRYTTLLSEYSMIPSAPCLISLGISSRTTLLETMVSTDSQLLW